MTTRTYILILDCNLSEFQLCPLFSHRLKIKDVGQTVTRLTFYTITHHFRPVSLKIQESHMIKKEIELFS